MVQQPRRVVILGAGFGGLFAALEFEKLSRRLPGLEVTLVDRNNYHTFVPLLYHVATGGIEPGNISFAIRSILKNGGASFPVKFWESEVLGLDISGKKVATDRMELTYDYLIFAMGSTTNFYGIPGLYQHVTPLKTIRDGVGIHNKVLDNFEAAAMEPDERRRRELLTFVVVGGGATGIELSCTMATFVFNTLRRDFPGLVGQARVVLVEAADRLLRGNRPELGRLALKRARKLGIEVMLNCRVASADADGIRVKDGPHIPSQSVTWVGGIKPSPLLNAIQAQRARDGRIIVDANLQVPTIPGVYVVGDCAYALQQDGAGPYPPTAQTAVRMGKASARNIARSMLGHPPSNFNYKYKGDLVFIGRNYAVGEFMGRVISGLPAFWMYQLYHLMTLIGFKSKLVTLIDWAYDYFYRHSTVKLD